MIVYYSKNGHCEAIAKELASINDMEIIHLEDAKKPNFIQGCIQAVLKKESKLKEIPRLTVAERIIVVAPIWADVFPPAINTLLPTLQTHPDVVYIGSCMHKNGNEKYSPKIQKIIPNAKTIVLYQNLEMEDKINLINQILV